LVILSIVYCDFKSLLALLADAMAYSGVDRALAPSKRCSGNGAVTPSCRELVVAGGRGHIAAPRHADLIGLGSCCLHMNHLQDLYLLRS
jgi:hypothetical protein